MTTFSKALLALAFSAAACSALPGQAAQNNSPPDVPSVCFTAYDLCNAACDINSPDSGLNFNEYISNQGCLRQCVDQLNACISTGGTGGTAPARKMSHKQLVGPIFGMDEGSSSKPKKPGHGSAQPPEAGYDKGTDGTGGKGGKGGFEPHLNFGSDTLQLSTH